MTVLVPFPAIDLQREPVAVQNYARSLDELVRAAVVIDTPAAVSDAALPAAPVGYVQADLQTVIDRVTALTDAVNALRQAISNTPVVGAPTA